MKIAVLTGSPHKSGTTSLLAERFVAGAEEAGHSISRLDAAFSDVHPCIGCDMCECGARPCIYKDDMQDFYPNIVEADVIAYFTPLYYHGVSAQLKDAIDRFHGINDIIRGTGKNLFMFCVGANPNGWIFDGLITTLETTSRYLGWRYRGGIFANACAVRADIERTDWPDKAYEMGRIVEELCA